MTPADIRARIADLGAHAQSDPERFHNMRDALYLDVLRAVATIPHWEPTELAVAALEAEDVTPEWEACA